jgi:hypothetical protein
MTQAAYQTVRLAKGRHESPDRGVCVMELASMLAGDRFTDHPRDVCPVIAGFLRSYNDLLPDGQHGELYAVAARVVGTRSSGAVRRRRARLLMTWAARGKTPPPYRHRFWVRARPWDLVLLPAVEAALRLDPDHRRTAVATLLDELCAMGRPAVASTAVAPQAPATAPAETESAAQAVAASR